MALSKSTRFNLALALVMALIFAVYHLVVQSETHWSAVEILFSLLLFGVLMLTYAGMADARVIARLKEWVEIRRIHIFLLPIALFIVTLAYIAFAGSVSRRDVLTAAIYLFMPPLLLWWDRKHSQRFTWENLLALLIVWWMIEWRLVPRILIPPRRGIYFFQLVALNNTIFSFLVVRGLKGVGYRLLPNGNDWRKACIYLGLFTSLFAIPVGLRTGFIQPTSKWQPIWQLPFILLSIFFFTGIPEEFVFRGILHNLLANTIRGKHAQRIALAISSTIFGLAHINNPTPPLINVHLFGLQYSVPWVYLILATIAGWFYGLAYIQTGSILAAAMLHAMVDGWWRYFFGGG